jgi:hypothetical protein
MSKDFCPYRVRDRMIKAGIPPSIAEKKAKVTYFAHKKKIQHLRRQGNPG